MPEVKYGLSDIIDLEDLKALPREFMDTFKPSNIRAKGYPFWTWKGDTNAFFALFFDSMATQLSMVSSAGAVGFTSEFVYKKFIGGVVISLFFGNVYYALQASKIAMRTGTTPCAQPYGINTPGSIAKIFSVLGPALLAARAEGLTGEAAMKKAWSVGCAANLVGGLVEFSGAFLAVLVFKLIPYGAMMVPIGGIGLSWLGYGYFIQVMAPPHYHFPVVALIPFIIFWVSFFGGNGRLNMFGPLPAVAVAMVIGIVLCACVDADEYKDSFDPAADFAGEAGLDTPDLTEGFKELKSYGSLVAAIAFTNFIGTYACNIQARIGGDYYSPMESMMVDGFGTMLGALLGSPWGTTVYIGHTTYKQMGATRGYSAACGTLFLILGLAGLYPIIDAILPHDIYVGILPCIGMLIASQCYEVSPSRWWPAVSLGLMITWSDMIGVWGADPDAFTDGNPIMVMHPAYVWTSMLWTFLFMMLTDKWWLSATVVLLVMTFLTSVGVIHSDEITASYDGDGHLKGAPFNNPATWKIIVSYASAAGFTGIYAVLQKGGYGPPAEEEDFRILQQEKYGTNKKGVTKEVEPPVEATA